MNERARFFARLRSSAATGALPPSLVGVDRALRIPVAGLGDACSVVIRAVGGAVSVVDGARIEGLDLPALAAPVAVDDLVSWCDDPDRLLGEIVSPEDLAGDRLFLVSCFDGLVGAAKGASGRRGALSA